jgi:hypothetical protein
MRPLRSLVLLPPSRAAHSLGPGSQECSILFNIVLPGPAILVWMKLYPENLGEVSVISDLVVLTRPAWPGGSGARLYEGRSPPL